jgi:type I restriction-modification system DNA methylase subunit
MTMEEYLQSLDEIGLDKTWMDILKRFGKNNPDYTDGILSISNFGELYEIGLAHVNKQSKKELGKYFTPDDVATLMAKWLDGLTGKNVCDVCCGV